MKKKHFLSAVMVLFFFLLISCRTDRGMFSDDINEFEKADFLGMVYDSRNRPCNGVGIYIDDETEKVYYTDVNGRFVIQKLASGDHLFSISKKGYESQEISLSYTSRKQILYVRMVSQESLIDWAEDAMESLDWNEAEAFLARAETIDSENSRYLTIQGTFEYLTDQYELALSCWMKLIEKGHKDPFLYLMIADAYDYGLKEPLEAAKWLEKYLNSRNDEEQSHRLSTLMNENR